VGVRGKRGSISAMTRRDGGKSVMFCISGYSPSRRILRDLQLKGGAASPGRQSNISVKEKTGENRKIGDFDRHQTARAAFEGRAEHRCRGAMEERGL